MHDQLADDVDSAAVLLPDSIDVSAKVSKELPCWITNPGFKMELGAVSCLKSSELVN